MLIQITNHCTLECPHCFQNSTTNGNHMTEKVFRRALEFGAWSGCYMYNISGGEPTEHPDFERFMQILSAHLDAHPLPVPGCPAFTIESNGEWIRSVAKVNVMKKVLRERRLAGLQISSFRGLYRNFDFIQKYRKKIEALSPKVAVFSTGIASMINLGRARMSYNPMIEKAIKNNTHQPCCINTYFGSKQTEDIRMFSQCLFPGQTCKPFIDWKGYVHGGESICCPAHGNIMKDSFETIWQNIREAVPCGRCSLYRNLQTSQDPKIAYARLLMGIPEIE